MISPMIADQDAVDICKVHGTARQFLNFRVLQLICAVFAVQVLLFVPVVNAAVPVEESVEETGNVVEQVPLGQRGLSERDGGQYRSGRLRGRTPTSLDIPPTIEPTLGSGGASTPTQNEVIGSRIAQTGAGSTAATSPDANGNQSQLGRLFYQMQVLQQEVQTMRGQLEDQEYLIKRLQKDQKDQYRDVDKRLVALSKNRPPPGPGAQASAGPTDNPLDSTPTTAGTQSERQAYTDAFNAMRSREFDSSLAGFKQLIVDYPNGQFTPNSYYWIGELHLAAQSNPEEARQAFMQVVNLYPDHQKAPDALYKLGVVYHNLGDIDSALAYLKQVQRDYPNTSAAGLAGKYASELQ